MVTSFLHKRVVRLTDKWRSHAESLLHSYDLSLCVRPPRCILRLLGSYREDCQKIAAGTPHRYEHSGWPPVLDRSCHESVLDRCETRPSMLSLRYHSKLVWRFWNRISRLVAGETSPPRAGWPGGAEHVTTNSTTSWTFCHSSSLLHTSQDLRLSPKTTMTHWSS